MRAEAGERNLAEGVSIFRSRTARPPKSLIVEFIDEHREKYGVEPMCKVMPIAQAAWPSRSHSDRPGPSSYYEHVRRKRDPEVAPKRVRHDLYLQGKIQRVWSENYEVYGYRKVWRQLLTIIGCIILLKLELLLL